jgi:hypothetical protein
MGLQSSAMRSRKNGKGGTKRRRNKQKIKIVKKGERAPL